MNPRSTLNTMVAVMTATVWIAGAGPTQPVPLAMDTARVTLSLIHISEPTRPY